MVTYRGGDDGVGERHVHRHVRQCHRSDDGVGGRSIANGRVIGDVAGSAGENERGGGIERGFHIDGGGQAVPIHRGGLGGVARLRHCFGHHHSDDVADMMDFVPRQHGIGF